MTVRAPISVSSLSFGAGQRRRGRRHRSRRDLLRKGRPPCAATTAQGQRYSLTAISGTFTDSFEPNNTRASARRVGPGTLLSKMYSDTDEDWYRFNLSATGTVSIVLEVPPSEDLQFDLVDGSGAVIASCPPIRLAGRTSRWCGRSPALVRITSGCSLGFQPRVRRLHAEAGRRHDHDTFHAARRFRRQRRDGPGRVPVRDGHVARAEPVRRPVRRTG